MKFSKIEIDFFNQLIKKIEEEKQKKEKIRISQRRKSQLKGKTINKQIQKKKKPTRQGRKITKRRSSIL